MTEQRTEGGKAVAIVGIGCRFPGGVESPGDLWRLLSGGVDAISEIPSNRIDLGHFFDPRPATPGRMMTRWGGFLDHIDEFDPGFFGISPREAERMDPQQRLVLETAWEALEDAGIDARRLEGSNAGVFVGQWLNDFEARLFVDPEGVDFQMTTGSGRYATSGRISYVLGLRGPSITLDTACSSSLAAVHFAVRSIRDGQCSLALAGGVNVILQPHISVAYSQSRMMAPDGRCKFGDASGDGYVRSEGAALIVLKVLDQALADGDRIYAVVRGTAVNNDGRSSGSMGTPSRVGQEELLRSAYRDAGLAPGRVGYVEAHGTGTRAGDPVELGALGAVLGEGRAPGQPAYVGSVKTNFGHTEGAAGVAGLIKVALALHHGAIPPNLHFKTPNPTIPWADAPFRIPTSVQPWPASEGPKVGGVSAFGIAGTNAHIVLEQAIEPASRTELPAARDVAVLPLSAASPEALHALAGRYADLIGGAQPVSLHDVCWNAALTRAALDQRAVFVAADPAGMADALRRYAAGEAAAAEGAVHAAARPKIAFVLPGQGAQWTGMARELAAREPEFRHALEQCDAAARKYVDWSIVEQLAAEPGTPTYKLDRIDVIQPVLVALAIAYARLWRSLGVVPDAVVGHSMGEVGAACIAGVLDLDQAMRIICRRSALMRRTSGQGAMALVDLSMDEARARIAGHEHQISVAVSNSPRSSVISGDPEAIRQVMAGLEAAQVFCRLIKVDVASHSPQMEPLAAELEAELADLRPQAAQTPIYSTVLARRAEGEEFGAGYWASNMRQPVMFGQAVGKLVADGVTVFIELGPHPVLLPSVAQTAQAGSVEALTIACGRREEPEQATFFAALGALWAGGVEIDWRLAMGAMRPRIPLPLYPWQRERHWVAAAEMRAFGAGAQAQPVRPDDEALTWLHTLQWRALEAPTGPVPDSTPASRYLLVCGEAASGTELAEAMSAAGLAVQVVSPAELGSLLEKARTEATPLAGILALAPGNDDAAYFPVQVLQACLAAPGEAATRLWFLTCGAQAVAASPAARVVPDQAAAWGAARVVAEEHPQWWGGLVDLDPSAATGTNAAALLRHLLAGDGEDQVALRGGQRFALRLAAERRDKAPAFVWRPDAAYLITGGLGDIGLHLAHELARRGVRRLVLMGRTPLPPRAEWLRTPPDSPAGRRIAALRALEAMGVTVHVASVDVSDEAQLQEYLDRYAGEAWPAIRGVVHAAGSFANELAARMDRRTFDAVVRPKLLGAQLLDRLLPDLDLFVMFSSTGAFLAQPGQANYAAANAGLDAVAQDRQARGLPAMSIAWGVWADTGLVKDEAGVRNVAEMARQGIGSFAPERGAAMFAWLCGQAQPTTVVLPMDWAAFRRARGGRDFPIFRELMAGAAADAPGTGDLAARLGNADTAGRRQILDGVVRDTVSRVLKIPAARLDPRKTLGSMGLNSLMAMELRNRLEAILGRPLSATLAWNYPTVEALVSHLAGADPAAPVAAPAVTAPRAVNAADLPTDMLEGLGQLSALSDEDAALALRSRRKRT
ncbi:MAG: type I polyketide synthase [Rhodocyclales bacterium]|nr:type I polyketide synthase [Rhodocyclales bacterium]